MPISPYLTEAADEPGSVIELSESIAGLLTNPLGRLGMETVGPGENPFTPNRNLVFGG